VKDPNIMAEHLTYEAVWPPYPAYEDKIHYKVKVLASDSQERGYRMSPWVFISVYGYSANRRWDTGINWEFDINNTTRKIPEFKRWPPKVREAILRGIKLCLQMPFIDLLKIKN
jgi:hypothetical protein